MENDSFIPTSADNPQEPQATSGIVDSPQVAPAPQPQPAPTKKKSKLILVVVAILVLLGVLIGGGAWGYTYYTSTPEYVSEKFFNNWLDIKSYEYSGEVSTKVREGGDFMAGVMSKQEVETVFSGTVDLSDEENLKNKMDMSIEVPPFTIGFSMVMLGEDIYLKLGDLPALGMIDLSAVTDQWIEINLMTLEEEINSLKGSSFDQEKEEEKIGLDDIFSAEKRQAIEDIFQKYRIIELTEKLPSERIGEVNTHHFKYVVNNTELGDAVIEVVKLFDVSEEITDEEIEEIKDKALGMSTADGEIWIGKSDYYPYKLLLNMEVDEGNGTSGLVSLTMIMGNFNQPVEIEKPEGSVGFKELLSKLFGEAMMQDNDSDLDSDEDGLSDKMELEYGTDPNNPDTDGDSYLDGEEISNGYNPKGEGLLIDEVRNDSFTKSKDTRRLSNVKQIQTALELYYQDQNVYPTVVSKVVLGGPAAKCISAESSFAADCTGDQTVYMSLIPTNQTSDGIDYTYEGDGKKYSILFVLEGASGGLKAGVHTATPEGIK